MPSLDTSAYAISSLYRDYGAQDFSGQWIARDAWIYDMVGVAAAQTVYPFFTIPAGQNDPNLGVRKTREQTNLQTPGQIGGTWFFVLENIRLGILNSCRARQLGTGVSTDAYFSARQLQYTRWFSAMCARGALEWKINDTTFLNVNQPFQTFSAGWGLGQIQPPNLGFTDGDPVAINSGANALALNSEKDFDRGSRGDSWSTGQPVVFAPSTNFEFNINSTLGVFPTPANIYGASADQTATIWLVLCLQGQMVRPRS